jgi:hypothetical protein
MVSLQFYLIICHTIELLGIKIIHWEVCIEAYIYIYILCRIELCKTVGLLQS